MSDTVTEPETPPAVGPVGPGRLLTMVYGFFALAATGRSGVQLATQASEAPLAYGLSALAAVTYLAGTVLLARADDAFVHDHRGNAVIMRKRITRRQWATVLRGAELAGVLLVGLASYVLPQDFPDATVWSHFGSGYGYVPLLLPVLGLVWLRRRRG